MPEVAGSWNEAELLAGVFQYPRLILARGAGSYVWDVEGKQYLDFTAGLGVLALGHGRADLADVLRDQFATLGHVSNLYGNVPALELARRLKESSFASRIWFANSGTEANEAAIKFARLHGSSVGGARKNQILAFKGGFHGRTLGALAATHHPAYRKPFAPLPGGFRFATFNDLDSVAKQMSAAVAAVIVEPVQGEGGVVAASPEFLPGLRQLCDAHKALLVFDEVQCGLGRTGTLYAYQGYGVVPDLLTLAKPLAGGLPLGALLIGERVATLLKPGHHGSTFSGGPPACAVGVRVFDTVSSPEFLAAVVARGEELRAGLETLVGERRVFVAVRGRGLMRAVAVAPAWKKRLGEIVAAARERGLLVTRAGDDAVRLLPPLNCTSAEIETAVGVLRDVARALVPRAGAKATARPVAAAAAGAAPPQPVTPQFAGSHGVPATAGRLEVGIDPAVEIPGGVAR
jgi:predicted acetylornithine/succinylornithine family transaminase